MGLVGLQAFAAVIALALGGTVGPETDDTATLTGAESTTTNPAPAAADDEAAPSFEGNFRFSGGKKQRQGVIDAVERAVQALLPVFHDLARERLGKANRVPNRIVMERDGNDIVVTYGDLAPMRAPIDGTPSTWRNREGTKCKLTHELRGNRLVQTSWSASGRRVMVWTLSEDGSRLKVHSTMSSMHLPVDIDYRLTFRK